MEYSFRNIGSQNTMQHSAEALKEEMFTKSKTVTILFKNRNVFCKKRKTYFAI